MCVYMKGQKICYVYVVYKKDAEVFLHIRFEVHSVLSVFYETL